MTKQWGRTRTRARRAALPAVEQQRSERVQATRGRSAARPRWLSGGGRRRKRGGLPGLGRGLPLGSTAGEASGVQVSGRAGNRSEEFS